MQTNKTRLAGDLALPNMNTTKHSYLEIPRKLLGTWIWRSDASKNSNRRLVFRWRLETGEEHRAIKELNRMSNRELFDIGLSRSDLTVDGLMIAGAKRAQKQELISKELANQANNQGVNDHGY